MAIVLEPKHTKYLIELIKAHPQPQYWNDQQIISKLQNDLDEKEKFNNCPKHIAGEYTGKMECCIKCGSFYNPKMGFSWTLSQLINTPEGYS